MKRRLWLVAIILLGALAGGFGMTMLTNRTVELETERNYSQAEIHYAESVRIEAKSRAELDLIQAKTDAANAMLLRWLLIGAVIVMAMLVFTLLATMGCIGLFLYNKAFPPKMKFSV